MRLLLAACFALNGIACAEHQHPDMAGVGSASCAKYAEDYRTHPDQTDEAFVSWTQGYVSGINTIHETQTGYFFDLNAKTPDEMKSFLRQYCNEHPLANYADGVMALLKSLTVVQRDKK